VHESRLSCADRHDPPQIVAHRRKHSGSNVVGIDEIVLTVRSSELQRLTEIERGKCICDENRTSSFGIEHVVRPQPRDLLCGDGTR
jgi:hypothetical protein